MDSTDWPAHVFGRARFERFEKIAGGDTQAALELYLGEQEEALDVFLVLSLLEVGLRNVVCAALERQGQPWYEVLSELLKGESAHLLESKKKVAAEHQRDRLIASLTFGFWCSLFSAQLEATLWNKYLCSIGHSRSAMTRKQVAGSLKQARTLRNRIAHHEPIANTGLHDHLAGIFELLRWVSNDLASFAEFAHMGRKNARLRQAVELPHEQARASTGPT